MATDPLPAPAPAPSKRKPAVRATRLPDALGAELERLRATPRDRGHSRADAACVALRDAAIPDRLLVQIARRAPAFAAALTLAFDVADEDD